MAGSSFGTIFRLTTWGESHGKGVGVVVDGVPAGLSLSEEDIQFYLDRRKPGQNRFTTKSGREIFSMTNDASVKPSFSMRGLMVLSA